MAALPRAFAPRLEIIVQVRYTRPGVDEDTMLQLTKETQMDQRIGLFISCASWMRRCVVSGR